MADKVEQEIYSLLDSIKSETNRTPDELSKDPDVKAGLKSASQLIQERIQKIENTLIQDSDRLEDSSTLNVLKKIYSADKNNYSIIFNSLVSPDTQIKIRLTLLHKYVSYFKYSSDFIRIKSKIDNKEVDDKEIKILIDGLSLVELVTTMQQEYAQIKFQPDRCVEHKGTEYGKTVVDQRLCSSKSIDFIITTDVANKVKGSHQDFEDPDIHNNYLNKDDRKELEEIYKFTCELSYTDYVGALIKLKIDKLEERINDLTDKGQSFFSFLFDLAINFALPFALGKLAEGLVKSAVEKSQDEIEKISQDLEGLAKSEGTLTQDSFISIAKDLGQRQSKEQDFIDRFNKISPNLTDHIDDYVEKVAELPSEVLKYRESQEEKAKSDFGQQKINDLDSFILYSAKVTRENYQTLVPEIIKLNDVQLSNELGLRRTYDFKFYSDKIKDEWDAISTPPAQATTKYIPAGSSGAIQKPDGSVMQR